MALSFEKPHHESNVVPAEKPRTGLDAVLETISRQSGEATDPSLFNPDNSINMDCFSEYSASLETDKKYVQDAKLLWSGSTDMLSRESFKKNYGFENESEESITQRMLARAERMKEKGRETEKMTAVLLNKALGSKFIIVQASEYDDYYHGIDKLLINRETWEVVGAFDDTHTDEEGKGAKKKQEKILSKLKKGGGKAKYAFTYQEGRLVRGEISNMPVFYLALTTPMIKKLSASMDLKNVDALNEEERAVWKEIEASLFEQIFKQINSGYIRSSALRKNILRFKESLLSLSKK